MMNLLKRYNYIYKYLKFSVSIKSQLSKLKQKNTIESEGLRSCGRINWNVRDFWAADSHCHAGQHGERGRERKKARKRKRRRKKGGMTGYTRGTVRCTRNWIGFLLIKISNLTPECAVFNETVSGVGARFSHYSHRCRSYKARYI